MRYFVYAYFASTYLLWFFLPLLASYVIPADFGFVPVKQLSTNGFNSFDFTVEGWFILAPLVVPWSFMASIGVIAGIIDTNMICPGIDPYLSGDWRGYSQVAMTGLALVAWVCGFGLAWGLCRVVGLIKKRLARNVLLVSVIVLAVVIPWIGLDHVGGGVYVADVNSIETVIKYWRDNGDRGTSFDEVVAGYRVLGDLAIPLEYSEANRKRVLLRVKDGGWERYYVNDVKCHAPMAPVDRSYQGLKKAGWCLW